MSQPRMTAAEIEAFLDSDFPIWRRFPIQILDVQPSKVRVALPPVDAMLRPGGTVSGPTLMTFADIAMFIAVLAAIGPCTKAFTSHLSIDFLRRASSGTLVAEAELYKVGKQLAVGGVAIWREGEDPMVAHANVTYSLPAQES